MGMLHAFNAIVYTVFASHSTKFIDRKNGPFQYEVGFESVGFAVIGFIAA
jgi:hypothetical protein